MFFVLFVIGAIGTVIFRFIFKPEDHFFFLLIMLLAMAPGLILRVFTSTEDYLKNDGGLKIFFRLLILYTIFALAYVPIFVVKIPFWTSCLILPLLLVLVAVAGEINFHKKNKNLTTNTDTK
jgi:hypothetical protein